MTRPIEQEKPSLRGAAGPGEPSRPNAGVRIAGPVPGARAYPHAIRHRDDLPAGGAEKASAFRAVSHRGGHGPEEPDRPGAGPRLPHPSTTSSLRRVFR